MRRERRPRCRRPKPSDKQAEASDKKDDAKKGPLTSGGEGRRVQEAPAGRPRKNRAEAGEIGAGSRGTSSRTARVRGIACAPWSPAGSRVPTPRASATPLDDKSARAGDRQGAPGREGLVQLRPRQGFLILCAGGALSLGSRNRGGKSPRRDRHCVSGACAATTGRRSAIFWPPRSISGWRSSTPEARTASSAVAPAGSLSVTASSPAGSAYTTSIQDGHRARLRAA